MGIDEQIRTQMAGGVATVVASRDGNMRPSIARGWGIHVSADGREVTLCVGAPPRSIMRSNLESNGAIAVTCSRPTTYRTVQLKGRVVALREPTAEQLKAVDEHLNAFSLEAEELGLQPNSGRRLMDPGLIEVRFEVRDVYDQTPGPNAGGRM